MNTRSSRKQFLIAASELSRLRLIEDFSSLSEGFHRLTGSAGSIQSGRFLGGAARHRTGCLPTREAENRPRQSLVGENPAPRRGSRLDGLAGAAGTASSTLKYMRWDLQHFMTEPIFALFDCHEMSHDP